MPEKAQRLTAAGDPSELSFIGVLLEQELLSVTIYLRCRKHNKKIEYEDKVADYHARKVTLTSEQKEELADLMMAAATENNRRGFVVGHVRAPSTAFSVLEFSSRSLRTDPVYIKFKTMPAKQTPLLVNFLHKLNQGVDPYRNFEDFVNAITNMVNNSNGSLRFISELDTDTGYGTYC